MDPRRVAFVASECEPWAKTGGLADVVDALARALGRQGVQVDVYLPAYRGVRHPRLGSRMAVAVPVASGAAEAVDDPDDVDDDSFATVDVLTGQADGYRLRLVDHPYHFDRDGFYGDASGDYPDNGARFALLGRAALEAMRREGDAIDVIHGHDWQSAVALIDRDVHYRDDPVVGRAATVLTLHNLAYHGWVPRERCGPLRLPASIGQPDGVDLLREAILAADMVTTVSPTYAREALTPEYGMDLEDELASRGDAFVGIMNGIDPHLWDPATDRALPRRYALRPAGKAVVSVAEGKAEAKRDLARRHGLRGDDDAPLFGMIGRLDQQKGFDLLAGAAGRIVDAGGLIIALGTGHHELLRDLRAVASGRPGGVAVIDAFDREEARRIYAGSDVFLMPSRFEPSGQGQLIAFRYGTPVVARRTGGLADSVVDDDEDPGNGNGFLFDDASPEALLGAVERSVAAYRDRPRWEALRERVMTLDHSWARPAQRYLEVYRDAMTRHAAAQRAG
jgi:starch synthase